MRDRDILGFNPIHTPIGTQISVATNTTTDNTTEGGKPEQESVPDLTEPDAFADKRISRYAR